MAMGVHEQRFAEKVAIVTGGGIADDFSALNGGSYDDLLSVGAAISVILAAEGCRVAVLDRELERAQKTVDRIQAAGGRAIALRADVTNDEDCRSAVADVVGAFDHLDVLMNSLGIRGTASDEPGVDEAPPPLLTEVGEEAWDRTMHVNVKAMMLMAKHAAAHFGDDAAIVNIASTGALRPLKGTAAYAVSKGAVISLTYAMAVELAPTRANCVSPGRVWTPAVLRKLPPDQIEEIRAERRSAALVGREGTALDIARAAVFLASDDAQWITGQHLLVDGGASLMSGETPRASGWTNETTKEPVR
jgi:NAD(P)-dependent dehydrogenase (short-subunit alcohol dehydrogenase family)